MREEVVWRSPPLLLPLNLKDTLPALQQASPKISRLSQVIHTTKFFRQSSRAIAPVTSASPHPSPLSAIEVSNLLPLTPSQLTLQHPHVRPCGGCRGVRPLWGGGQNIFRWHSVSERYFGRGEVPRSCGSAAPRSPHFKPFLYNPTDQSLPVLSSLNSRKLSLKQTHPRNHQLLSGKPVSHSETLSHLAYISW